MQSVERGPITTSTESLMPFISAQRATPVRQLWSVDQCKTLLMAPEPDDDDSPFAHVPASGAGPGPLQEGPFTYERLVASTGRGTVRDSSGWRRVVGLVAIGVVGIVLAAGILAMLLR
jgi:hypothetical protein